MGAGERVRVDVSVRALSATVPSMQNVGLDTITEQATQFQARRHNLVTPTVHVGARLWRGLGSEKHGKVVRVDALLSAAAMPSYSSTDFTVKPSGTGFGVGYGFRLGVLEESPRLPGISFSTQWRNTPHLNMRATVPGTATTSAGRMESSMVMKTVGWRGAASKRFGRVGLTAGLGSEEYDGRATVAATVAETHVEEGTGAFSVTREVAFAGVSVDLRRARLVGELGRFSGKGESTFNTINGESTGKPRTYVSLGLRLGN